MANENSLLDSMMEQLPNEIFLQIFGYLHLQEIIKALYGLNSRINSIIQSMSSASHIIQYNDPNDVQFLQIFSQQITRLVIVKTDIVDFTSLSNLRSLTLKYPSNVQLKCICTQDLLLLETLRIYVWPQTLSPENAIEVDDLFQMIFNNAFPRLRLCTALGVVPLIASDKWSSSPSLHFLYVPMKTTKDYERLLYICPNLRWFPSCKNVSVDPVNQIRNISNKIRQHNIWNSINELNQLELENKFILEINPFIVLKSEKYQSYEQSQNSISIYGRIFPEVEPYCHSSFLIKIEFLPEYPFKEPQITFMDPICNPNIDEKGKISFRWRLKVLEGWKPSNHLVDIIRKILKIDEQDFSINILDNEKPPKNAAQQLLQYLDILYPNGEPINPFINVVRNISPIYKEEVHQFFRIVDQHAQDFDYDVLSTYQMTNDPDKIAKANWIQIKQMLTSLLRAEKFSLYNNAYAIEQGSVKWILLRLKELVEQ